MELVTAHPRHQSGWLSAVRMSSALLPSGRQIEIVRPGKLHRNPPVREEDARRQEWKKNRPDERGIREEDTRTANTRVLGGRRYGAGQQRQKGTRKGKERWRWINSGDRDGDKQKDRENVDKAVRV